MPINYQEKYQKKLPICQIYNSCNIYFHFSFIHEDDFSIVYDFYYFQIFLFFEINRGLSHNKLSGEIPKEIANLSNLQIL